MTSIEMYGYWIMLSGLIFNIWLALRAGKILGRALYASVAAVSFTRFCWACGREHGFKVRPLPAWVYAPQVWFEFFVVELGAPKGTVSHMGGSGVWKGIGDWTVFPAKEDKPCE
ncbi:hypothetical protein [Pseudomonas sp. zfem002]|uniref:hypothetical protein n=1 Tax=Pseudomonas sp. zfem002 TaxID=3078197 RepID=UPI002928C733|nr:hypothetical protein [Pseudomonas sp. zfem002]MDU9393727.1 hypothetical protein [Pseudomonas sp. zfem002]